MMSLSFPKNLKSLEKEGLECKGLDSLTCFQIHKDILFQLIRFKVKGYSERAN